ncbi:hypothetical protein [Enterococcus hirae]|uniref:hypothetical protein n=1 Tax=Enterococcus hirae TaxID=1354 RepID=UPI0013AA1392|nr:hypothetical protein [Enterococcus hirae]NAE18083.1 hypothetical protein [Enterococcus hirae]
MNLDDAGFVASVTSDVAALRTLVRELDKVDGKNARAKVSVNTDDTKSLFTISGQLAASAASAGAALATWGPLLAAAGGAAAVLTPALATAATAAVGLGGAVGVIALSMDGLKAAFGPLVAGFVSLKAPITALMTSGVGPLVSSLTAVLIPAMKTGLGAIATSLNGLLRDLLVFLSQGSTLTSLTTIMQGFAGVLDILSPMLVTIAGTVLDLGVAAIPGLQQLIGIVGTLTDSFSAFISDGLASGQLQTAISTAVSGIGTILTVVGQVMGALQPLFAAVGPPTIALLATIGTAVAGLGPLLGALGTILGGALGAFMPLITTLSATFLPVLGQIVAALTPVIGAILTLAGSTLTMLVGALSPLLPVLTSVATMLAGVLSGALTAIIPAVMSLASTLVGVAQTMLTAVLPAVLPLVSAIAGLVPAITPVITVVAGFAATLLAQLVPALTPIITIVAQVATQLVSALGPVLSAMTPLLSTVAGAVLSLVGAFLPVLPALTPLIPVVAGLAGQLVSALLPVITALSPVIAVLVGALVQILGAVLPILPPLVGLLAALVPIIPPVVQLAGALLGVLLPAVAGIIGILASLVTVILGPVVAALNAIVGHFTTMITATVGAVTTGLGKVTGLFTGLGPQITSALSGIAAGVMRIGGQIVDGLVGGITGSIGKVKAAAESLAGKLPAWMRTVLDIHSPSRVMYEIGEFVSAGLAEGMLGTSAQVKSATEKVADEIRKGFQEKADNLTAVQKDQLADLVDNLKDQQDAVKRQASDEARVNAERTSDQIAEYKRQAKARKTNTDTIAREAEKMQDAADAQARALQSRTDTQVKSLDDQIAAAKDRSSQVQQINNDAAEASAQAFLASVQVQQDTLAALAVQRDQVADQIKTATDKFNDAVKLRDDFAGDVAGNASRIGSLTSILSNAGDGGVSASYIIGQLQDATKQVTTFQGMLGQLQKMGLSDDVYKQLVDAGVQSGTRLAEALLAGGGYAVKQVNDAAAKLAGASDALGSVTAKHLYQAGVDAAQGLLDGLQSQQDQLLAYATSLANQIADAMRQALDIHSPSRVMATIGGFVGAGLAQGMEGSAGLVSRAAAGLAGAAIPGVQAVTAGDPSLADRVTRAGSSAGGPVTAMFADEDRALLRAVVDRPTELHLDGEKVATSAGGHYQQLRRQGVALPWENRSSLG